MRRTNPFAVLAGTTSSASSSSEKPDAHVDYYLPPIEARWRWMGRTRTALRKERRRQERREEEYEEEKPLPNFSGDRIVMYRLMQQVSAMPADSSKEFELVVNFHGRYTIKLIVKKTGTDNLELYLNENECIYIIYNPHNHDGAFMSQIYADTSARRCFTPAPNTSQFKMLDMLMVLTTKLMIAVDDFFYYEGKTQDDYYREVSGITITDIAKKDGVALTPYKLLRGGDGIYERYGYVSSALEDIKRRLPYLRVRHIPYLAQRELGIVLGRKLGADESVMPLMTAVTWEHEQEYGISEAIVDMLTPVKGEGFLAEQSLDMVLDRESEAWLTWDAEMQLGGVRRWKQKHRKTRRRH